MISTLLSILIAIGSLLLGWSLGMSYRKMDGLFILDESDPNMQRWILDVHVDPETIANKKEIRLKIAKMNNNESSCE